MTAAPDDTGVWPEPDGHPYIFGKQWHTSDLTLFYAPFHIAATPDEVRARMKSDSRLSSRGDPSTRWDDWYYYADWPNYFPRVSLADMTSFDGGAGWYDQVETLQGRNGTYVCHGILSFELVESVMRYARHLVEDRFH